MLLNNYSVLNRNSSTDWGIAFTNPHAFFRPATFPKFYLGEHVVTGETDKSSFPNGYSESYAYHLAPKSGGIAANRFIANGELAGSGANGLGASSGLSGSGDITQAEAGLIVSAIAALVGSGDITQSQLQAVLQGIATLSGSGDTSATLLAIGSLISGLSGASSESFVPSATGTLAADIVVTGETLTTANVAEAIWGALSEGNFTYAQCMQIISAACGGLTTNTGQTFRDLSDSKDRIVGTVSGGDRTAVTYDLD